MHIEDVNGGTLETWSVDEVATALDDDRIVLIDVRTPPEYMIDHIEGALLYPMAFFDPARLPGQGEKRIVLHCGSGARSEKMARLCLDAGVDRIAHMEGGIGAWKDTGRRYVGTDMATGAPTRTSIDQ